MEEKNSQPTYKRQRFLLAFIRQLQSGVKPTDLQKLVFLYTMEVHSEFYEFIPYKFGSYSFQLTEDIEILRRDGYLSADVSQIRAVGDYPHETPFLIATERGDALIQKAYCEYPYYAINSEIVGRLFHGAEAEGFKREKQKYATINQMLFTIGYEGKSIEAFINVLITNHIELLCDIRKNPLSRKFGFSKGKLEHITQTIGIQYIHIPALGIDSDKRGSLDSVADYQCLFREYEKTLSNLQPQLVYVYSLLEANHRIALMCYEKTPEMCHRHVVRDYLVNTYETRSKDL